MVLNDHHIDIPRDPPPHNYAVHKLNQLQADLVVTARAWAMDEIGAAVAHQLNEPLTALLIYLHEIEQAGERRPDPSAVPTSVWELVGKAVSEAERVCTILERMRQGVEAPVDSPSAVARGRDAINTLARGARRGGVLLQAIPTPLRSQHPLTPREQEVLALVTAGASNREGGRRLGISTRTFEVHRAHVMRKLGVRNTADLVRTALAENR